MSQYRPKVLIVDNAYTMRALIKKQLIEAGFAIAGEAKSISELLVSYFRLKPDIVIVEIDLEGFDPWICAIKDILSKDPNARIVAISGTNDESIKNKAISNGALDYIRKPLQGTLLADRLNKLLKNHPVFAHIGSLKTQSMPHAKPEPSFALSVQDTNLEDTFDTTLITSEIQKKYNILGEMEKQKADELVDDFEYIPSKLPITEVLTQHQEAHSIVQIPDTARILSYSLESDSQADLKPVQVDVFQRKNLRQLKLARSSESTENKLIERRVPPDIQSVEDSKVSTKPPVVSMSTDYVLETTPINKYSTEIVNSQATCQCSETDEKGKNEQKNIISIRPPKGLLENTACEDLDDEEDPANVDKQTNSRLSNNIFQSIFSRFTKE